MKVSRNTKKFIPTVEWLSEKYKHLNNWLFLNELGDCGFEVSSRGFQYFAHFRLKNRLLKVDKNNRKILFPQDESLLITRENIDLCCPTICFNSNFLCTERFLLDTLVHEMCHYYTYMGGYIPKRAHGKEFKRIAEIIYNRSNGCFKIQHYSSLELNDDYLLSPDSAIFKNMVAFCGFMPNGTIRLSTTTHPYIMDRVESYFLEKADKLIASNDIKLLQKLHSKGCLSDFRTMTAFYIKDTDFANSIEKNYKCKILKSV